MAIAVEEIPNEDIVNRLVDFPHKYESVRGLIWSSVFEFPDNQHESLAWSKYAPTDDAVHALGREYEAVRQARRADARYVGFLPYVTGNVREFRTARGHGFTVEHLPEDDMDWHAGISYRPADGMTLADMNKNDKKELKLFLQKSAPLLVPAPAA